MQSNLVIYHRVDYDGIFSACTVQYFIYNKNERSTEKETVSVLGYSYGDSLPDINNLLQYDRIWLVDVSFPPELMLELKNRAPEFIWIDHHITAIKLSEENGYSDLPGTRSLETSAAELVWYFMSPGGSHFSAPDIIQCISAYDSWNMDRLPWNDVVMPVQYALKAKYGVNFDSIWRVFGNLVDNTGNLLDSLVELGKSICEYNRKRWESAVKAFAFPITIGKKMKGVCMMCPEFSSTVFESVNKDYDIYCVVNRRGPYQYSVSIYGFVDRLGDFSCGDYMKKHYNGGGHKGAAGGILNWNQFARLVRDQTL